MRSRPLRIALPVVAPARLRALAGAIGIGVLLAHTGCATLAPDARQTTPDAAPPPAPTAPPPRPANVEPPPANVNLSGFPLPYRQGYADGCATAGGREQKDASRFASDGNYRTGWMDGRALCAKK
jgi:hypothetical protein